MSNIFQAKRVKVPGLLSDDGLALAVKELSGANKSGAEAAASIPTNSSAVDMADKVVEMGQRQPGPTIPAPAQRVPKAFSAAQEQRSTNIGDSIASGVQQAAPFLPGVGPIVQAAEGISQLGLLNPADQQAEQERRYDAAAKSEAAVAAEIKLRNEVPIDPMRSALDTQPSATGADELARRNAEQLQAARDTTNALLKAPKPTQAWWLNVAQVAARSAAQMGVGAVRYPVDIWEAASGAMNGGDVHKSEVGVWVDGVDKALTKMLPGDPARAKDFITQLAAGGGSMAGFLIAGWAAEAVGLPAGVAAGLLGAATEGDQLYQEAGTHDATAVQKYLALLYGTGIGLTEAIPLDRAFARADHATGGLVRNMLANTTATTLEEFVQEFGQTMGEDLTAKYGAGYDPERKLDPGSWLQAGVIGGLTGAAAGSMTSLLGHEGPQEAAKVDEAKLTQAVDDALNQHQTQFNKIIGEQVPSSETSAAGEVPAASSEAAAPAKAQVARPDPVAGDAVQQIVNPPTPKRATAAGVEPTLEIAPGLKVESTTTFLPKAERATAGAMQRAVETPAFKKWFGGSPITTETGAPLTVYHGSKTAPLAFTATEGGTGRNGDMLGRGGVYVTNDPAYASIFGAGGSVMPLYAAPQKVLEERDAPKEVQTAGPRKLREWAQQQGYDAIRAGLGRQQDGSPSWQMLVFNPTQIKSATANVGSFDPTNPDISQQVGTPLTPETIGAVQLEPSETAPLAHIEAGLTGPIATVVKAARAYAAAAGIPLRRQRDYVKVDTARAARIAQAYADMKHEPANPAVAAAYKAMAEETTAQYQFVKATGIVIEPIGPDQENPYPTPREVLKDIAAGHIWYFPTDQGFGTEGGLDTSDNPLLEATGEKDSTGRAMVVNDLFRVVHDFFGHGMEGSGFGPRGEENAWQSHMRLFSESAVPAMTSETRGQNSWVNYGPHGEANRANPKDTIYADQKSGLMPSWTWQEGVADSTAYGVNAPVATSDAVSFRDALQAAKDASPYGAVVKVYTPAKYAKMKTFITPDGLSGFALDGEDIVSVFSHNDAPRGRLRQIIDTAVANGGRTLDAFDTGLPEMYARLGFVETGRDPWNEKYAPKGWDYKKFGKPDVVYMAYTGDDIERSVATLKTHTPEFEAWSQGDVITEDDGTPMILYSGTHKGFRVATRAMWLTPDRGTAVNFAQAGHEDAVFDAEGNHVDGGSVYSFFARMENPYEYDWEGRHWGEGPETEYPTVYVLHGKSIDDDSTQHQSYGDAQQALSDAREQALDRAEENARDDMYNRLLVVEADGKYQVKLRSDAPTEQTLEQRHSAAWARVNSYVDQLKQANEKEAAKPGSSYGGVAYNTAMLAKVEKERDAILKQLNDTRNNPPQPEVLETFDTEDEARSFEETYTDQQAEAAREKADDEFDGEINEEYDYETDHGQTTDDVVRQAEYEGYDGVILRNVDEGNGPADVYVVLTPGNAKSTANIGTFNGEDPDIMRMTGTASTRAPYPLEPTRPTKGVPLPANPAAGKPDDTRLTNISANFRKLLDLTVRHGRIVSGKDTMGEYNKRTGAIRLRTWTDLSTLVHEGGHAINDSMAQPLNDFVKRNETFIRKVATTLYGGDLKGDPHSERREGFAEFFRVYTMNPSYARNKWANVVTDFETTLDKEDPQVRVGLNNIADQFAAWLQLPSSTLIRNTIIDGRREQGIEAAIKELKDKGFKTWMQEHTRRTIEWSINRYAPLNTLVTELLNAGEQNRGNPLDVKRADDPRVTVRLARNAGSRGMVEVTDGVIGYRSTQSSSRGLREAVMVSQGLDPNSTPGAFDEERMKDFSTYLVAKRALDEYERFDAGELERPPIMASKGDVVRAIKDYETKYKNAFIDAAQVVHEYGMALWQKQYAAGLMTKETYREGLGRNFYVPLQRDLSDKKNELGPSALTNKGSGPLRSVVQRFRGSDRDIIDPIAILMHKTFALEQMIAQNDAIKALAILADRAGAVGNLVERIPANQLMGQQFTVGEVARQLTRDEDISEADAADLMTILGASIKEGNTISLFRSQQAAAKGENILFFWENGKVAAIQLKDGDLGADVVNMMNATGRENMDWQMELIAGTSAVFRTAITSWPDFLLVNYVRDQMSAWVLSDVGFVPFVSGIRGMVDEVRQKGWAKSYNAAQGIMGGMNSAALHTAHVDRDINALRSKGYIANAFSEIKGSWDLLGMAKGFAHISALSETGTRLGLYRAAYERAQKDGLSEYDASVEAAYIATDYIDFGLNGSRMLSSRRLIPFLNAQLQGLYKMARTLGGDEVAQRKGLKFALTAYFKNIKNLPLSRTEKMQLQTGRKAWIKMVALGAISAALAFLFKDDPDYQETSEYLRTTGWVIPLGNGHIFYVPKPFELAMIANAVERGIEYGSGDKEAPGRFLRGVAFNLTPPTSPPAMQIATELMVNKDFFTGREIVPGYMQALEPELQYDNYTSSLAKWIGQTTHLSPMMVDHVMAGMGASAYRDLMTAFNAADPTRPTPDETDLPILRRFVRDVRRGSVSAQDFWAQASQTSGALERASQSYKHFIDVGNEPAANKYLAGLGGDERAYAVLMNDFKTDAKRLNPFYRARQITTMVSGMRRELSSALGLGDTTVKDQIEGIPMPATKKAQVDEILSEIARREVRNTLIATQQPGWAKKKVLDLQPTLDLLQAASPETYDEYQRRYAKSRIYNADSVFELWPDVRDRLVSDGQYAVLADAIAVASAGL